MHERCSGERGRHHRQLRQLMGRPRRCHRDARTGLLHLLDGASQLEWPEMVDLLVGRRLDVRVERPDASRCEGLQPMKQAGEEMRSAALRDWRPQRAGLVLVLGLAVAQLLPVGQSMRLVASTRGTVGSFAFADSSTGTHRVRCSFSASGGLNAVAVPAPKVKPAPGWSGRFVGQWVKWNVSLQEHKGSKWPTVGKRSSKVLAKYGRWTTLPSVRAFGSSNVSAPHGSYRIRETLAWYRPTNSTIQ